MEECLKKMLEERLKRISLKDVEVTVFTELHDECEINGEYYSKTHVIMKYKDVVKEYWAYTGKIIVGEGHFEIWEMVEEFEKLLMKEALKRFLE